MTHPDGLRRPSNPWANRPRHAPPGLPAASPAGRGRTLDPRPDSFSDPSSTEIALRSERLGGKGAGVAPHVGSPAPAFLVTFACP
jgi:hypothetical protein